MTCKFGCVVGIAKLDNESLNLVDDRFVVCEEPADCQVESVTCTPDERYTQPIRNRVVGGPVSAMVKNSMALSQL